MIGSLAEAKEIFDAIGDRWCYYGIPKGWTEVGDGSTRHAYLSPTGVLYKICKEYTDDEPSWNCFEHQNFKEIKERNLLPEGWFVPEVSLYTFDAFYTQWDGQNPAVAWGTVDVLACEYIPGREETLTDDEIDVVFSKIGLTDPTTLNAKVHGITGFNYIIDAGEWVERWPQPVAA